MEERRKDNIYRLLKKAEIDTFLQITDKNELLKIYEDLLKISFRGFYFVHKRDVDEVNINTVIEDGEDFDHFNVEVPKAATVEVADI